ncbi:hypothetical protein Agabi119p4_6288 [Agaricus bisporus var. burnettii]|uniref:Wings apart-like protein C-terminal domain-containing protein n=1 Tax=Agaricus bisporus var. burnettii TaxID=192524 RepID=A0A8H7C9D7_AGABI|nr:hypothetical protein Agabi119p4_6288 [Agaricus bisporus var. burnettii]
MKTYGRCKQDADDALPAAKRRRLAPDAGHSPPPPQKLTKRMLGRSKTESSIASPPAPSALASRTVSMPALPPSPPHLHPPPEQERRPAISAARVKRTYAGQSRSFLISLPVADLGPDAVLGIDRMEDNLAEPESYSSLRHRWAVVQSEEDIPSPVAPPPIKSRSKSYPNNATPSKKAKGKTKASTAYLPPNMMNPLKSITELRSKGESRRFLDEVGYLFEGMDPSSSTGLKRSSASEITTKLCDEEFSRKAKAADFYPKTWDVFLRAGAGKGDDKVLDILLVFLIALIARNRDALIELVHQEIPPQTDTLPVIHSGKGKEKEQPRDTFVGILFSIISFSPDTDPLAMSSPSRLASDLEFKQIGLSKKDKILLSHIYSTISTKSDIFIPDTPITTFLLLSHILSFLPPSYIPHKYLPNFLHSLRSVLHSSFPPNNPFRGVYSEDEPQFECIKNHLQLLDAYLLNQWASEEEDNILDSIKQDNFEKLRIAGEEWFVDGLISVAVCAEVNLRKEDSIDSVSECLEGLLRVLVNLTHHDEYWARKVINNEFAIPSIVRLLVMSGLQGKSVRGIGEEEDAKWKRKEWADDEVENMDPLDKQASTSTSRTFDRLCLTLGLLMNLVQSASETKDVLRRTKLSPTCSLKSVSCAKKRGGKAGCTCPDLMNAIQILVEMYNANQSITRTTTRNATSTSTLSASSKIKCEPSSTPPSAITPPPPSALPTGAGADEAHVIQDTLSILFGLLMDSSPPNQTIILSSLSTTNTNVGAVSDKLKLARLVEQGKDFVAFYDAMNNAAGATADGLGDVDGVEDQSASKVVEILERLRDSC